MNSQQIANRLVALLRQGDYFTIYDELFHPTEVEHVEPQAPAPAFQHLKGVAAIKAKDEQMGAMIQSISLPKVGEPIVSPNAIALHYQIKGELKDSSALAMDEVIVYELQDGKIVSERFFY